MNDPGARKVTFDQVYAAYREQVAGAARGRRRPLPGRDHHRHAELQGGDQGDPRPRGRGLRAAADLDQRHHHRPLRPHALRPDGRGVLELGAACPAVRRRPQLRARRRADAPAHRRAGAHRRHPGRRLSRTPACRTPWASTTRRRARPPATCGSGPRSGIVNIVGGCCGTTPDHIATSPGRCDGCTPRAVPDAAPSPCACRPGGLRARSARPLFVNIGERTNVTGSTRVRKLITARRLRRRPGRRPPAGRGRRAVIDVNMDEGLLDCRGGHDAASSTSSPPSPTSPACRS